MNTREKLLTAAVAVLGPLLGALLLTVMLRSPESFEIGRKLSAIERRLETLETRDEQHRAGLLVVANDLDDLRENVTRIVTDHLSTPEIQCDRLLVGRAGKAGALEIYARGKGQQALIGADGAWFSNVTDGQRCSVMLVADHRASELQITAPAGRARIGISAETPYLLFLNRDGKRLVPAEIAE